MRYGFVIVVDSHGLISLSLQRTMSNVCSLCINLPKHFDSHRFTQSPAAVIGGGARLGDVREGRARKATNRTPKDGGVGLVTEDFRILVRHRGDDDHIAAVMGGRRLDRAV